MSVESSSPFLLMKLPSILFLALAATGIASAADVVKPNVILMMADDMGMGDTSAFQDYTGNADEVQVDTRQWRSWPASGFALRMLTRLPPAVRPLDTAC